MTHVFFVILWCAILVAPWLIWLIFRSGGYKRRALDAPPGPDWKLTGERFIDPTSGQTLEVWQGPGNGERAYVKARSAEGT